MHALQRGTCQLAMALGTMAVPHPIVGQATPLLPTAALVSSGDSTGWALRRVRGAQMPEWVVTPDRAGSRVTVSGTGTAGWADLQVERPVEGSVRLQWSWRCLVHPATAALHERRRDDAPLRVVVGFGGRPGAPARAIAYTWGNAEPMRSKRRSHQGDRLHVVVVATAREADGHWHDVVVNPGADHAAIWGRPAGAITGVALLQDVDDTGARAVAEIRNLMLVPMPMEIP